jgi:hypothetical protein
MVYLAQLAALAFGVLLGAQLPDIDRWLFFLAGQHRSILTHSPLIPYALSLAAHNRGPWWRWGALGLAASFAAHLAFDLFPRAWSGYALIKVPLFGEMPPTLSLLVILGSVVGCWYVALRLAEHPQEASVIALAGFAGLVVSGMRTGEAWGLPLLTLTIAMFLAALFPNPALDGRKLARETVEALGRWRSQP